MLAGPDSLRLIKSQHSCRFWPKALLSLHSFRSPAHIWQRVIQLIRSNINQVYIITFLGFLVSLVLRNRRRLWAWMPSSEAPDIYLHGPLHNHKKPLPTRTRNISETLHCSRTTHPKPTNHTHCLQLRSSRSQYTLCRRTLRSLDNNDTHFAIPLRFPSLWFAQ